jgi:hypothetical protein
MSNDVGISQDNRQYEVTNPHLHGSQLSQVLLLLRHSHHELEHPLHAYRSQLADESTSAVWAKLQPIVKPETIAPKKPITPPRKNPVREAHVAPPSVPARPLPPRAVPRQQKPISHEIHSLGDAVADLAALIIPVKALGRAVKK